MLASIQCDASDRNVLRLELLTLESFKPRPGQVSACRLQGFIHVHSVDHDVTNSRHQPPYIRRYKREVVFMKAPLLHGRLHGVNMPPGIGRHL